MTSLTTWPSGARRPSSGSATRRRAMGTGATGRKPPGTAIGLSRSATSLSVTSRVDTWVQVPPWQTGTVRGRSSRNTARAERIPPAWRTPTGAEGCSGS